MADAFFWLVTAVIVTMATGAPLANQEKVFPASAVSGDEGDMKIVAKRAEEMVYYGNQQNEPRMPVKKSQPGPIVTSHYIPPSPVGEEDEGGSMIAHDEIPVEEDLNARAEAVRGASEEERMKEGVKFAEQEVAKAMESGESGESGESEGKDASEDSSSSSMGGGDSGEESEENIVSAANGRVEAEGDDAEIESQVSEFADSEGEDSDTTTDEDEPSSSSSSSEEDIEAAADDDSSVDGDDGVDDNEQDSEVQDFLQELSKEGDDASGSKGQEEPSWPATTENSLPAELESQWATPYGSYDYINKILAPQLNQPVYIPYWRNRRSLRQRRSHLVSMRNRRRANRIKRDLPADWLAYRNLDSPLVPEEYRNSLLASPEDVYEYAPENEGLSRYIYGNLLNKLASSYAGEDEDELEEEDPYQELGPEDIDPEVADSLLEEYEPEELMYDPEAYAYSDYAPYPAYRKRSSSGYKPDLRRKRYFYPAYEEPETHWGAFVPEKRNYGDALQRLRKLALALRDDPRGYYTDL